MARKWYNPGSWITGKNYLLYDTKSGWIGSKKDKKGPQANMIAPDPYEGQRPYSGEDVGLGAPELKTLSDQYRTQLLERSQGKGLVGYDPEYRATLESEFNQDLDEDYDEYTRQLQAQSAAQGQRGGIPLDLSIRAAKDFGRRKASGLAEIKIGDLEARRADINQATYAQPELVSMGSNIQSNRALFDMAEYNAEMPTYIDQPKSNLLPALIGAAGTIGGAYFGGPAGAAVGGSIAGAYNQTQQPTLNDKLLYQTKRRY